jgi:hypothetical protein
MEKIINRIIAGGLKELSGLEVKGQLPLRDELLNEFLQEGLKSFTQQSPASGSSAGSTPDISPILDQMDIKVAAKEGELLVHFSLHVEYT